MFQINKYLQFRNTPDGKPRVLVEGVDYDLKSKNCLWVDGDDFSETNNYIDSHFDKISLSDCRPLLTVEIDGVEWTEGDVAQYIQSRELLYDIFFIGFEQDQESYDWFGVCLTRHTPFQERTGSFFDNPAKYSQLLWDCSEEEGWSKVFKLLGS